MQCITQLFAEKLLLFDRMARDLEQLYIANSMTSIRL